MTLAPMLSLSGVCKHYAGLPEPVMVLHYITYQIQPGECLAIVGPSGCGKSTLLNLMGALDTPSAGRILFKGTDITQSSPKQLANLRNREIGFVFQMHHLLPQCTALENVLVPALLSSRTTEVYTRAENLLARVGLAGRAHHRPGQLSGGECQRVAVARALINQPSLLLADEPTGSLNEEGADQLADLLLDINRTEGTSLVVVTHSMSIARRIGRVLELRQGHLMTKE